MVALAPEVQSVGRHAVPDPLRDRRLLVVAMRRARTPVEPKDFMALERPYPDTTGEPKRENFGWLDGRVVEVDYGLAHDAIISERRAYYAKHARRA